jgi:hypothetical protein
MRVIIMGLAMLASGCGGVVPFQLRDVETSGLHSPGIAGQVGAGSDPLYFAGVYLPAGASGYVAVSGMTVCEFGQVVLSETFLLPVSCTVDGGSISMLADFVEPIDAFVLAIRTLERSGVDVLFIEDTVSLAGSSSGSVGGYSSQVTPDLSGAVEVQGVDAFTTDRAPSQAVASTGIFNQSATTGQRFHNASDRFLSSLAIDFSLPISVMQDGSDVLAFGTDADLQLLRSIAMRQETSIVTLPVNGTPVAALLALSDRHFVSIDVDAALGLYVLSGAPGDVSDAIQSIRVLGGSSGDVRIETAFVRSYSGSFENLGIEPGLAFDIGDLSINSGSSQSPLSLVLEALQVADGVNIDLRPVVTVAPGATAQFISGAEVPFISGFSDEGTNSDVEYRSTGSIVNVVATPRPGGFLRLQITLEVSSSEPGGVLDNPIFSTRSIETTVSMRPGQIVLLSGLSSQSETLSRSRSLGLFPSRSADAGLENLSFLVSVSQN